MSEGNAARRRLTADGCNYKKARQNDFGCLSSLSFVFAPFFS